VGDAEIDETLALALMNAHRWAGRRKQGERAKKLEREVVDFIPLSSVTDVRAWLGTSLWPTQWSQPKP